MKSPFFSRLLLGMAALSVSFVSCSKDDEQPSPIPEQEGFFYGEKAALGQSEARSYIRLGDDGAPVEVGIIVPEEAMATLGMHETMLSLGLPAKARTLTAYQHMMFDWMPHGHEPAGVFDKPHFDLHFYYTSEAERMAIQATDTVQFMKPVEGGYIPQPYINIGGVPQMGAHWIDPTGSPFNGEPFTSVLIYGSYDGEVTFVEPMIAKAFIEEEKTFQLPILQPDQFPEGGKYYPTIYGVEHDEARKQYRLYVGGFLKN
ncbi:MAG: DUF5602 domain-containing protein [Phaeodactylibacter sp.]|nr:DUF5602 domain-containing protein [Phaeodactylibacter sp.]